MTADAGAGTIDATDRQLAAFVAITLALSWSISIATIGTTVPTVTAPLIMFVPAVVTLLVTRMTGTPLRQTVGRSLRGVTGRSLGFAVVYPVVFIGLAAGIALVTGLGSFQPGVPNAVDLVLARAGIVGLLVFFAMNFVITYGEELGWRGFLLPALTERWGRVRATLAVGAVWGVYHSAFLYLAARALGVPNPAVVTVVQAAAVVTISFPFAYSYYLSRGSVVAPVVLHLVWNVLNPWLLGDVYGNARGLIAGQPFVLSGEGALGLVLGAVVALGFVGLFRREVGVHRTPR